MTARDILVNPQPGQRALWRKSPRGGYWCTMVECVVQSVTPRAVTIEYSTIDGERKQTTIKPHNLRVWQEPSQ